MARFLLYIPFWSINHSSKSNRGTHMSQIKYDQRTETNIATLQPDFAERVRDWLTEARRQGLNPLIHFGARSIEKQEELHDASLITAGPAP
jgi:hypothetical protein